MRRSSIRSFQMAAICGLLACGPTDEFLVDPLPKHSEATDIGTRPSLTIVFEGGTGDSITYTVQAHTSFNNQFVNIPTCVTVQTDTSSHLIQTIGDSLIYHHDRRTSVIYTGSPCDAPSPYNGGWVNVYETDHRGDHYAGQVYGDMVWRDFTYVDTTYKDIKLHAIPASGCSFLQFDGYSPTENPITILGEGALPLAKFAC